ncbi:hypothetical protein H4S00_000596 [Coemansia sp. D1744]|nr:hypothetical protein H4S00_000596 [Coemansia sp. D1744]
MARMLTFTSAVIAVAAILAMDSAANPIPHLDKRGAVGGFGLDGIGGFNGFGLDSVGGVGGLGFNGVGGVNGFGLGSVGGISGIGGFGLDSVGGFGGAGFNGIGFNGAGVGTPALGGWGVGGSGFGFFPFATSFTNQFDANNNFAHFNDDTLYVNDKDATVANNNVHSFNNANVIV